MKYKSILALSLAAMLSFGMLISGCGNSTTSQNGTDNANTANNATDSANNATDNGNNATGKLDESMDKAGDAVKDGVEGVGDTVKYSAMNFKDDLTKAGRDIKDSLDTKKDYFSANETDYLVDGDLVRVYEFDNASDADKAVSEISADGLSINNSAVYTTKPSYYRKDNTIVVYEGTNNDYITEFNGLYGNPIV